MTHQTALDSVPFDKTNPAHQYLASLRSKGSFRTAESTLQQFVAYKGFDSYHSYPWHSMRAEDLNLFARDQELRKLRPNTINTRLSILKRISKESFLMELITLKEFERIKSIKRAQGSIESPGQMVEDYDFKELIKSARARSGKSRPGALRDAAILCLTRFGGLRRSEISHLDLSDCVWDRMVVKVKGKGKKERDQPLPEFVMDIINDWINVRGEHDGPLFMNMRKGGVVTEDRLTDQGIYHIITSLQKGKAKGKVKPHDLRRTYCTSLLNDGHDLIMVSNLMGHADISTTKIYDQRGVKEKTKVARSQKNFIE